MPELPEVETIRLGLSQIILGQNIKGVTSNWPKSFICEPNIVEQYLVGASIEAIDRRAKMLIIKLSSGYSLVIHLKMTGQLVYRDKRGQGFAGGHPTESLVGKLPDRSTRVIFELERGRLYFNDQRKFGWIKLLPTAEVNTIELIKKAGPEPLEGLGPERFKSQLMRRHRAPIKAVLLDQTIVAGLGNIYSDEALNLAKIHPLCATGTLSDKKITDLLKAIKSSLRQSLAAGGSTDRNYVNARGERGKYLESARVYGRTGQPCLACGTAIIKIKVAGRGSHFCPKCQKLARGAKP